MAAPIVPVPMTATWSIGTFPLFEAVSSSLSLRTNFGFSSEFFGTQPGHLPLDCGAEWSLSVLRLAYRNRSFRAISGGALGQCNELCWNGSVVHDRVPPLIEGDGLRKQLSAVTVGYASHRVDCDPQGVHFRGRLASESAGRWAWSSSGRALLGRGRRCRRRRRPRHFEPVLPLHRDDGTPRVRSRRADDGAVAPCCRRLLGPGPLESDRLRWREAH
jgi:hypothetical protein